MAIKLLSGLLGTAAAVSMFASPAQAQWGRRPSEPVTPPSPLMTWLDSEFSNVFGACGQNVSNIRRRLRNEPFPFVPTTLADYAQRAGDDVRTVEGQDDQYAFSVVYTDRALTRPFAYGRLYDVDPGENDGVYVVPGNDLTTRGHNCVTLVNAKMESRAAAPLLDVAAALNASVRTEQRTTALVRSGSMESIYFNALSGTGTGGAPARRLEALASVWRLQTSYYNNGGAEAHPSLFILPRMKGIVFSTVKGLDQTAMLDGSAHAAGSLGVIGGRVESTARLQSTVHVIEQDYSLASWERDDAYQLPAPTRVASEISAAVALSLETIVAPPPQAIPSTLLFRANGLPSTLCDPFLWEATATAETEGQADAARRSLVRPVMAVDQDACKITVLTDSNVGVGEATRITLTLRSAIGGTSAPATLLLSSHAVLADRQARLFVTARPERVFSPGRYVPGEPFTAVVRYQFGRTGLLTNPRITSVLPRLTCGASEPVNLSPVAADKLRWEPELMSLEVTYLLPAETLAGVSNCAIDGRAVGTIARGTGIATDPISVTLATYALDLPNPPGQAAVESPGGEQ